MFVEQEISIDINKGKKWKLWRTMSGSRSGSRQSASEAISETSSVTVVDSLSTAVATLVRAPPRDFHAVRQEWAAVRIQSAFRAFLVKYAYLSKILNCYCAYCITSEVKYKKSYLFPAHTSYIIKFATDVQCF
jgi:hypothetical protein